jgi:hypothetical protein
MGAVTAPDFLIELRETPLQTKPAVADLANWIGNAGVNPTLVE